MEHEAVSRGTWDEFQKRCALQHEHLAAAVDELKENVKLLNDMTKTLTEAMEGRTWFRQMMTGLVALAIGLQFPSAFQVLKAALR